VQRVEGEGELDPVDQTVGHRVVLGQVGPERLQQREVGGVQLPTGQLGQPVVVRAGHGVSQVGSAASASRSLARQRPRVGPMLPCGMPSACASWA